MQEYNGRINIFKDDMLFVVNEVFEQNVKNSISKENILKLMPKIYENAVDREILKLLPYKTYLQLEKMMEYIKTNDNINNFLKAIDFREVRNLEYAMIVVSRAKYGKYEYSLNPGVLEQLKRLYTKENRKIAEKYGEIEALILGMLYSYGVVEYNFYRNKISEFIGENIKNEEIDDICYKRLNLNPLVTTFSIEWTNSHKVESFITYLNEELAEDIAVEQKSRGLKYKEFSKQQILNRQEIYWDENTQEFYDYMKKHYNYYWQIKNIFKDNEIGENITSKLLEKSDLFDNDIEMEKFMNKYIKWYNNSPQYPLGGYTPNEMVKRFKK